VKRSDHLLLWPALIVVILDQLSKYLIQATIPLHGSIPILGGFFDLVHVRNRGFAFGLMNRPTGPLFFAFLVAATTGALILLFYWFRRLRDRNWTVILGISLILGGAVGNLIDRLRYREVIDFLDFYVGPYHWPAFNLADSAITIGTIGVALNMLFSPSTRP
jgi:signal peptidase II